MILLLELARGLAALWVFFYHVKDFFITSSPIIYQMSGYGSLGVPMFFVISGYVITCSAESCRENSRPPFSFLRARFLRIYPAFWISVIVVLLVPYIVEAISALKSGSYSMPESVVMKLNYVEWFNFLLLSKVFFAATSDLQAEFNAVNSVYWTLAIEFQFYLVVFLALCFGKYYRNIILLISVAGILVMFVPNNINYGLFIHYWPSFAIGIILAYLHRYDILPVSVFKNEIARLAASLIMTALLVSIVALCDKSPFLFATCFGTFLWMISDLDKVLVGVRSRQNSGLRWLLEPWLLLGAMSYSVYLLHGKIYVLPNMFVRQLFDHENILHGILTIVGTLMLCSPFYFFVERRFLSKNYKTLK